MRIPDWNEETRPKTGKGIEIRDANDAAVGWMGGSAIGFGIVVIALALSKVAEIVTWSGVALLALAAGGLIGAIKTGLK